jgi:hypothetical protein
VPALDEKLIAVSVYLNSPLSGSFRRRYRFLCQAHGDLSGYRWQLNWSTQHFLMG